MTALSQAPTACQPWDAGCQAGQLAQTGFQALVAEIARGTGEFIVTTTTWWTTTPSVDPLDPAVGHAQSLLQPVTTAVLVGSILVQAIRMILSRKADPLAQVALGLLRYALTAGLGLTVLHYALAAGDALATRILDDAPNRFAKTLQAMLMANPSSLWIILLLSSIATVLSVVQWLLMALRQAGLLVLAAMLTLAASGSLNRATRGWLDRLFGWLLAIVVYKPAAAFVYYLGFSYLSPRTGTPGNVGTVITGVLVLGLAVVAMPVLLKFFSWSGTQIGGSGGSGSGALAAAGAIALARAGRAPTDRTAALDAAPTGPSGAAAASTRGMAARAATGPVGAAVTAAAAAGRGAANQFTGRPPTGGSTP